MAARGHSSATFSASKGAVITPADNTEIPVTRGLYVGGTGNLTVKFADNGDPTAAGGTVLISAVPVGAVLPIQVNCINSTNTTATLIVALY
jgi:hypothetical protein